MQLDCLTNPTVFSESGDSDSVASLLISSKAVLSLDLQRHLWRNFQYHLNINQAKWKTWYFESDTSSRVPILFESQPVRKNFIVSLLVFFYYSLTSLFQSLFAEGGEGVLTWRKDKKWSNPSNKGKEWVSGKRQTWGSKQFSKKEEVKKIEDEQRHVPRLLPGSIPWPFSCIIDFLFTTFCCIGLDVIRSLYFLPTTINCYHDNLFWVWRLSWCCPPS